MKKTYILAALGLLFLALPLGTMLVDIGEGTDDQAGKMIKTIQPDFEEQPLLQAGYEPSETSEPWLFALQVSLGVALFGWAYYQLRKPSKQSQQQQA